MKLLANEEKILTLNNGKLILTNCRIYQTDKIWRKSIQKSIFLEDISSIEIKYKSNVIFIVFAISSIIAGIPLIINGGSDFILLSTILFTVSYMLWWLTRQHIIEITTKGCTILNFIVKGNSDDQIAEIIYNLSHAKKNRIDQLYKVEY